MRNSEDFSSEPDYQAINSRLIGKPVLSSYLNAREYIPKDEEDKVGQREEGYTGGTDYQALNSRLIGKPVLSSYLSGGRYIPASEEDRDDYIAELKENQGYFDSLFRFLHPNKGPRDPNSKMDFTASAAYAGFYPEKFTKETKKRWEDRKKEYLNYLDIPTRAYFFSIEAAENKDKLSEDKIPEELALLMRFPYFRSVASLLGTYLYKNKFVEIIKDEDGNEHLKVSGEKFDLPKFMKDVYYPNVVNWSRQVVAKTKEKMDQGITDRKEAMEEAKKDLKKSSKSAFEAAALAIAKETKRRTAEVKEHIEELDQRMLELSNKYDNKDFQKLLDELPSKYRSPKVNYGLLSGAQDKGTFYWYRKSGKKSPGGAQAVKDVERYVKDKMLEALKADDYYKDFEKYGDTLFRGNLHQPAEYVKKMRSFTVFNHERDMEGKKDFVSKLADRIRGEEVLKAPKLMEEETKKRQAIMKKIKDTRAKNKEAAKKEETNDGEKPASVEATTQKTKKGRAASSTTGTKSTPKVGSAALGAKTPTKKGTRNKNPASTSDTLPVAVSPPAPKVRGKKSASPGNKKRVTPRKKKSVPTSAALPPPPAEETSSPAVPPTEEGRGKKRAGTPPSAAPPRKRRTRGANPTARSYDLRERKNVSYD